MRGFRKPPARSAAAAAAAGHSVSHRRHWDQRRDRGILEFDLGLRHAQHHGARAPLGTSEVHLTLKTIGRLNPGGATSMTRKLTTLLAAAFIAAGCSYAIAQGGGSGGAGGGGAGGSGSGAANAAPKQESAPGGPAGQQSGMKMTKKKKKKRSHM